MLCYTPVSKPLDRVYIFLAMRLQLKGNASVHRDMVTAVAWTPDNELYSISDDKTIHKWDMGGEPRGKVTTIDGYGTSISWFPAVGKQVSDMFALGLSDGTIRLMSRAGREEKKIDAHNGAVVRVAWNYDGSALCSCGEDGDVKIWSRGGNLRSTLLQTRVPVYAICWSPDNEQIVAGNGKMMVIKSVQAGKKQIQWSAHDGVVTTVDWSIVNDLIVSGGEDCTYRVWDSFGRQLYQSSPVGYVVTAVAWAPNGQSFAVGAYNMLRLCDATGWTHCRERPQSGSIMNIVWTSDGTQLVGSGGNGMVVYAQVVGRSLDWEKHEAVLAESHKVIVQDVSSETCEVLEFPRDRVVDMALGHGHLIVATATQCFIYAVTNWNTPHIFDMRGAASLIALSAKHFLTVDSIAGVQVWSYEGRPISSPRLPNLRPEFLNRHTIALSSDVVAILDRADGKTVRLCDVASGRPMPETTITHDCEVIEIALSQSGTSLSERRITVLDRNRDLWLYPITVAGGGIGTPKGRHKLQTQVDSVEWSKVSDVLAVLADGRMVLWYYPNAVYVDKDLMALACSSRDAAEFGKSPRIQSFSGSRVTVRRADGALLCGPVPPYPDMLHEMTQQQKWHEALRLCRFVKSEQLWACCAAMALHKRNLDVAEMALAAIKAVDKLEYILTIKAIPSEEGRNAQLALCRRCPDEAEKILLQASPPLVHRAIKLNIHLYKWSRALELAVQYRSHVDTVLAYRQRYLNDFKREETDARFQQYASQVTVDWDVINAKEEKELEEEGTGRSAGVRK